MYLDPFYSRDGHYLTINAEQGSRFAKDMASDFNPLHNPDSKRFCVPGDLLFALVLAHYGISPKMTFLFKEMVPANTALDFSPSEADELHISLPNGKACLSVERSGEPVFCPNLLENFSRDYVAFSGQNFPHALHPLFKKHNVMLNPSRPTVIYERMSFEIDTTVTDSPQLAFAATNLQVNGKRGEVNLDFTMQAGEREIGRGYKRLLLSGLRPYDDEVATALVAEYEASKAAYYATQNNTSAQ